MHQTFVLITFMIKVDNIVLQKVDKALKHKRRKKNQFFNKLFLLLEGQFSFTFQHNQKQSFSM